MAEDHRSSREPQSGQQQDLHDEGRRGLFGRINTRFNDALQSSRGPGGQMDAAAPEATAPRPTPSPAPAQKPQEDLAARRPRSTSPGRMIIPEGVIIEGNVRGSIETEIHGRIEGDVVMESRLVLGPSGVVTGNVNAASCVIEGQVDGNVDCSDELELGAQGRLNADANAGRRVNLAGQVHGNVDTPGVLRLASSAVVNGDVRARNLSMEEGATLNGRCNMRTPAAKE